MFSGAGDSWVGLSVEDELNRSEEELSYVPAELSVPLLSLFLVSYHLIFARVLVWEDGHTDSWTWVLANQQKCSQGPLKAEIGAVLCSPSWAPADFLHWQT